MTFSYKDDAPGTLRYGLIAEEVQRVYPELVFRDDDGKVLGVRYDLIPVLLLKIQNSARRNRQKNMQIPALQKQMVAQQKQLDVLQKETPRMDELTARLNTLVLQARYS